MNPDRFSPQSDRLIDDTRKKLQLELFLVNDVEGDSNIVLQELENKFKQYRWFVGLALMGSSVRGYSTGSSDVDLKIFYNNSEISSSELAKIVKQSISEVEELHGFETGHVSIPYFVGFNDDMMRKSLQDTSSQEGFKALLTLKDLSGPVTGEKIQGAIAKLRDLLTKFDIEQRDAIFDKVVDHAMLEEKLGEKKLMQRLGMKEEDMTEFWRTRRELWIKHVHALWQCRG